MGNIIWIASYPKSGNTWFRVFLTNLLQDGDVPADINDLERTPIASARALFDEIVGVEAGDLTLDEVDSLRPEVYRYLSDEAGETLFMKIHDAYTYLPDGRPLVPPEATRSVIYIIRNPLDVVISFANHMGIPIDRAVKRLADDDFCFAAKSGRLHDQLRQRLFSWSKHVCSWTESGDLDVHIMRYEDMTLNPEQAFTDAVMFAGLEKNRQQIKKALGFSRFSELQRQERENGFKERPVKANLFFRMGESGYWRNVLSETHIRAIIGAHKDVMKQYGYLGENGEPVI